MANKIRYVTPDGRIEYADAPLIKPIDVAGEEGFGVVHSPITVTPTGVYKPQEIKPRFFSEEVADQRDAAEIRRKQADEKVKQMFSGKEYAKLGGLTLAGAAAAGTGAAGLGYLSTLPGTVAGKFIGETAGSMAFGMGLEEGQRAAFGRSAGDIVYSQLKPYIGEFGANMARPEYIISPSMVLKNTYTQATNNLGRQFADQTAKLVRKPSKMQASMRKVPDTAYNREARIAKLHDIARIVPDVFEREVEYMPNSRLAKAADYSGFTPMYEGNIGGFNVDYKQELLDRLKNFEVNIEGPNSYLTGGVNIDKPITFTPDKVTGEITITPRDYINNLSSKVYYGLFDEKKYSGLYFTEDGLVFVDPTIGSPALTAMHEVLGHRLDTLIKKTPASMYYNDILGKMHQDIGGKPSDSVEELRATLLEAQRKLMFAIYDAEGRPNDLSTLRGYFRNAIDKMSDDQLMDIIDNINGYGEDYKKYATPEAIKGIRQALKYLPAATGISVGLNNNTNNTDNTNNNNNN